MHWTEEYFDEDYFSLYEGNLTAERTQKQVSFLIDHVFDATTQHILDMPCGYGRHDELLAKAGYMVHGIDASESMLQRANHSKELLPSDVQKRLSYETADMREYAKEGAFDAALNLFSSLGYFRTNAENERVVANICTSVREGGKVVIDVRNPVRDVVAFSNTQWRQVDVYDSFEAEQMLDPVTMQHTLTYRYVKSGQPREKTGSWRHYFFPELHDMLDRYGCSVEKVFGNFEGEAYAPESPRLIIVARKR